VSSGVSVVSTSLTLLTLANAQEEKMSREELKAMKKAKQIAELKK